MADARFLDSVLAAERQLWRLALSLAHDPHDAEDAVRHALGAARGRAGSRLAYLRIVVRNWLRSRSRADLRRQARERRAVRVEAVPSVHELAEREELRRRVAAAVIELQPPYREVVWLHYFEDASVAEIARATGTREGTVRVRLHRAREQLRARLDRDMERSRWCWLASPWAGGGAARATASFASSNGAVMCLGAAALVAAAAVLHLGQAGADEGALVGSGPVLAAATGTAAATPDTGEPAVQLREPVLPPQDETRPDLTGRVVDESGHGLADAVVIVGCAGDDERGTTNTAAEFLNHVTRNPVPAPGTRTGLGRWLRTDARGTFEVVKLHGKPDFVLAYRVDRSVVRLTLEGPPKDRLTLVLPRWPRITGTVRDPEGRGAADVQVDFRCDTRDQFMPIARTDADGRYASPGLPEGDYSVYPQNDRPPRFEFSAHRKAQIRVGGADVVADFVGTPLERLRATLVDSEGSPWTLARVSDRSGLQPDRVRALLTERPFASLAAAMEDAFPAVELAYDSEQGSLEGPLPEAPRPRYVLELWADDAKLGETILTDLSATKIAIDLAGASQPVDVVVLVRLPEGMPGDTDVTLSLVANADALFFSGEPLASAPIRGRSARLRVPGVFAGRLCWLVAQAPGLADAVTLLTLPDPGETARHNLDLVLEGAQVHGQVRDDAGRPIAGAQVEARNERGERLSLRRPRGPDPGPLTAAATDADGRFELARLPRQRVRLLVSAKDLAPWATTLDLGAADAPSPVTCEAHLTVGRSLTIHNPSDVGLCLRLLDAAGAPILDDRWHTHRYGATYPLQIPDEASTLEILETGTLRLLFRGPLAGLQQVTVPGR